MKFSDIVIAYKIIKDIGTDWTEFKAYELGIINDKGEKIRDIEGSEDKAAYNSYWKLIFNLKRIIQRFVGKNKTVHQLVSLLMLKEGYEQPTAEDIANKIIETLPQIYESDDELLSNWKAQYLLDKICIH